jgi:hypothetical protein
LYISMGFFSNILGGIKNATNTVVGAVKKVTKTVGTVAQSTLDASRDFGLGSKLQSAGAALALGGLAVGATGFGAPLAAAMETAALGFSGVGTGLRAAEVASNNKIDFTEKITRAATDVAVPVLLAGAPIASKYAANGLRFVGREGVKSAYNAARLSNGMMNQSTYNDIRLGAKGVAATAKGIQTLGKNAINIHNVATLGNTVVSSFK